MKDNKMKKYPKGGPDLHAQRKEDGANKNAGTLNNKRFLKACELAGIQPTKRQASKWNNMYGAAYAKRFMAAKEIK